MALTLQNLYDRCDEFGECRLWKHALINGHPQARINGKSGQLVRRYIFSELLGKNLRNGYVVIPRCREPRCIAAGCLTSMSYGQRLRLAYKDGNRATAGEYIKRLNQRIAMGTTVFSFEKAREIRARTESNAELAREYGVHRATIRDIRQGKTWREAMPNSSVFHMAA